MLLPRTENANTLVAAAALVRDCECLIKITSSHPLPSLLAPTEH